MTTVGGIVRDERGLVGKAIVILMLVVAVLGLCAVDAGSILFAKLKIDDAAEAGAVAGAEALKTSHNVQAARQAAVAAVHQSDDSIKEIAVSVDVQGNVTVKVKKKVPTILVGRIGFLKKLGVVHGSATESPPSL